MIKPPKDNPRNLWRPRHPELTQRCASCPFSKGNDKEFGEVVARLGKAAGVKPVNQNQARFSIKMEAENSGEFICHGTAYYSDMSLRHPSEHRQCPGASAYYKKCGEES
jgi:hypothetical protein